MAASAGPEIERLISLLAKLPGWARARPGARPWLY
jgi:hypothetical protein